MLSLNKRNNCSLHYKTTKKNISYAPHCQSPVQVVDNNKLPEINLRRAEKSRMEKVRQLKGVHLFGIYLLMQKYIKTSNKKCFFG